MSTYISKELEKLYTQDELIDLINVRRAEKQAAERLARNEARNNAIEQIKALLQTAEKALRDAGDLGDRYTIDFTFADPKNCSCNFHAGWQSSLCYVSDGWYAAEYLGETQTRSTVDGQTVEYEEKTTVTIHITAGHPVPQTVNKGK